MSNLIVADSEYTGLSAFAPQLGKAIESDLESYFSILTAITDGSIRSGDVYNNLVAFAEQAQKLQGQAQAIAILLGQNSSNFVQDIDAADLTLY